MEQPLQKPAPKCPVSLCIVTPHMSPQPEHLPRTGECWRGRWRQMASTRPKAC